MRAASHMPRYLSKVQLYSLHTSCLCKIAWVLDFDMPASENGIPESAVMFVIYPFGILSRGCTID